MRAGTKFEIQKLEPPRGFACRWDEDVLVVPPNFALHAEGPQLWPLTVPTGLPFRLTRRNRAEGTLRGQLPGGFRLPVRRAFSPGANSLQSAGTRPGSGPYIAGNTGASQHAMYHTPQKTRSNAGQSQFGGHEKAPSAGASRCSVARLRPTSPACAGSACRCSAG